jgi:glucose-1-phosphate cytidylyltransferase
MQVVIMCGGTGTRLKEQTEFVPKPLIPIGGIPMVVHIMRLYAHYGFKDFVLALGYKQEAFKQYFAHYNLINNTAVVHTGHYQPDHYHDYVDDGWKITMVDTGVDTIKGERLKMVEKYIIGDTFMCTYGDAVSNINLDNLLAFHKKHKKLATITGVHPEPRFGEIIHSDGAVISFTEKQCRDNYYVNGGFMVFNREIFNYLPSGVDLEMGAMGTMASEKKLMVYYHTGFWKCMDNMKDLSDLQNIWDAGNAPWGQL